MGRRYRDAPGASMGAASGRLGAERECRKFRPGCGVSGLLARAGRRFFLHSRSERSPSRIRLLTH